MVWCMQRTNIYLEERQTTALDELAHAQGVSRAEVIRRIIDRALANDRDGSAALHAAVDYSFGALSDVGDDIATERVPGARAAHLEALWSR